jgi:hypothetical protein
MLAGTCWIGNTFLYWVSFGLVFMHYYRNSNKLWFWFAGRRAVPCDLIRSSDGWMCLDSFLTLDNSETHPQACCFILLQVLPPSKLDHEEVNLRTWCIILSKISTSKLTELSIAAKLDLLEKTEKMPSQSKYRSSSGSMSSSKMKRIFKTLKISQKWRDRENGCRTSHGNW